MPIWLTLLGYAVKGLMWYFGDSAHQKVIDHLMKYQPLAKTEQSDPTPSQERNPNILNHPGGL